MAKHRYFSANLLVVHVGIVVAHQEGRNDDDRCVEASYVANEHEDCVHAPFH